MFMKLKHNQAGHFVMVVLLIILAAALVGGFVLVAKRQLGSVANNGVATTKEIGSELKGLSFSPKSFGGSGITDFFDKAKLLEGAVTWAGDWQNIANKSGGPSLVISKSESNDLLPITIVGTHTDAGQGIVKAIRPLTDTLKTSYVQNVTDFATSEKPAYMGLGIEINRIYESSVMDYQWFVDLFNKSVLAIRAASPDTKVFTTFQLERIKGLKGGLFGGQNNEAANNWSLLDDFGSADLFGFTSYPGLIYHSPADIPSEYYTSITAHTSKPILFSELGWPAGDVATGWNSTPVQQQQFVSRFFELTKAIESQVNIWSFLYDPETVVPFNTMGLYSSEGTERAAWQEFLNSKK